MKRYGGIKRGTKSKYKKNYRNRGKIKISSFMNSFKEGDNVAVIRETSVKSSFPKRIQGRTGTIEKKQGKAYYVNINESNA